MSTPKDKLSQIDIRLTVLQNELERLHSLYEQHFAGVLKKDPQKEHQQFKTALFALGPSDLKSTVTKFRHQGLQQRYTQYSTFWAKIMKQIEEGTYRRDLFLLEKKAEAAKLSAQKPKKPTDLPAPSKSNKALELLYEKMKTLAPDGNKLPPKEKFVAALQKQIEDQRKKNPDKRVEIKLQKDANGQMQIRLSLQKKE